MVNFFSGINIGLRALQTQKKSLDVTGHNIANANTEGYSRQRVIHSPTRVHSFVPGGGGIIGTGVQIEQISRVRDQFIDNQINQGKQSMGFWEKRYEGLHRIELTFNEPSESSLNSALTSFWKSLQELSVDPQDAAVRETVKQKGLTLTDTFNVLNNHLLDYKKSLNDDVRTIVQEINSLSQRIADLNFEIVKVKGTGNQPNDLMDSRDLLFEKLNSLVNVSSYYDSRGNMSVSLGGTRIVDNTLAHILEYVAGVNQFEDKIIISRTQEEAFIDSGELNGVLNIRDEELNYYFDKIDEMATVLANRFNEVHKDGFDLNGDRGLDFFVWYGKEMSVNQEILNDINKISAGSFTNIQGVAKVNNITTNNSDYNYQVTVLENQNPNFQFSYVIEELYGNQIVNSFSGDANYDDIILVPQDFFSQFDFSIKGQGVVTIDLEASSKNNFNSFRLANVIERENLFNDGKANMLDYYKMFLSSLGVDGQRAYHMINNNNVLLGQLNNQRESISGVNLDEEMADMIKYQQAYQAAAKIINTTDRMLDTLMSIIR